MAFLDLILLAAIAGFLGYRLWVILGTHDADKPIRKKKPTEEDLVIPVRAQSTKSAETEEEQTAETATAVEDDRFLQGASIAFQKIVGAYASGDTDTLNKLLEGPLLETFEDAIKKRAKARKILEVDIGRIVNAEIIDKREEKDKAYVTVRFVSEQCLVTKNSKGKVVEGDPDQYITVTDIWTFTRSVKSKDPNWKLVATQVPEV